MGWGGEAEEAGERVIFELGGAGWGGEARETIRLYVRGAGVGGGGREARGVVWRRLGGGVVVGGEGSILPVHSVYVVFRRQRCVSHDVHQHVAYLLVRRLGHS